MGRQPCCDKVGLKRGPWSIEEDHKLMNFIFQNGIQCWRTVPKLAGLLRCGKSCRLRWINYLRPDLKRGSFTDMEDHQIIQLHARLGNRWSKIASHFPGRTDNEIKNHWNTRIQKRLKLLGAESVTTHKPIVKAETSSGCKEKETTDDQMEILLEVKPHQDDDQAKSDFMIRTEENREPDDDGITIFEQTTDHLLKNHEMLCGIPGLEPWLINQETHAPTSYSHSLSLEESHNPSISESQYSVLQDDSLRQCVDSIDSMLAWDSFIDDDDDLSFL